MDTNYNFSDSYRQSLLKKITLTMNSSKESTTQLPPLKPTALIRNSNNKSNYNLPRLYRKISIAKQSLEKIVSKKCIYKESPSENNCKKKCEKTIWGPAKCFNSLSYIDRHIPPMFSFDNNLIIPVKYLRRFNQKKHTYYYINHKHYANKNNKRDFNSYDIYDYHHNYLVVNKQNINSIQIQILSAHKAHRKRYINLTNMQKKCYVFLLANNFFYRPIVIGPRQNPITNAIRTNIVNHLGNQYRTNYLILEKLSSEHPQHFLLLLLQNIFPQFSLDNFLHAKIFFKGICARCNKDLSPAATNNNLFVNLQATLNNLCNSDISKLNQLAILFAKVYLGRHFLGLLRPKTNNCTLILTNDINYIKNFLTISLHFCYDNNRLEPIIQKDFIQYHQFYSDEYKTFSSKGLTFFTCNELCSPQKIPDLIQAKFYDNIVNIDTPNNHRDFDTLKKVISGNKIYLYDSMLEKKLTYSSDSHYIFICQSSNDKFKNNLKQCSDIIDLSDLPLYLPSIDLNFYERFFLVTTFVEYGIDLIINDLPDTVPPKNHDIDYYVKTFVDNYIDKTGQRDDWVYKQSSSNHSEKGLYDYFSIFLRVHNPNESISLKKLSSILKNNHGIDNDKASLKDNRAIFCGIKFHKDKFLNDMQPLEPSSNINDEFNNHLCNMFNDYIEKIQ